MSTESKPRASPGTIRGNASPAIAAETISQTGMPAKSPAEATRLQAHDGDHVRLHVGGPGSVRGFKNCRGIGTGWPIHWLSWRTKSMCADWTDSCRSGGSADESAFLVPNLPNARISPTVQIARHSAKCTCESWGGIRRTSGRWSSSCTGQRGRDSCHAGERGLQELNSIIRRTTP